MADISIDPIQSATSQNDTVTTARCPLNELSCPSRILFSSSTLNRAQRSLVTAAFLILLFTSFLSIVVYISVTARINEVSLKRFSLDEFKRLETIHANAVIAHCTQMSIPYETFLRITPKFHQICSSPFIDGEWISALFLDNATSHNILDFRTSAFAQFRALALLCKTARRTVRDAYRAYSKVHLISHQALSRSQFDQMMDALIDNFKNTILINERRTLKLISINLAYNRLISALRTNYYIQSAPGSRKYATYNGVYMKENDTDRSVCDCRLEGHQCFYQAGGFYNWSKPTPGKPAISTPPPRFQIPGLKTGCLPLESMRESTLECLYNQSCVDSLVVKSGSVSPKALNISLSVFPLTKTVGSMFDESLFVESWSNSSNFSQYISTCAPRSLSYIYSDEWYAFVVFTICMGTFAGLFIAWKLILFLIVKICNLTKRKSQSIQSNQLEPVHENTTDSTASVPDKQNEKKLISSETKTTINVDTIHISLLVIGIIIVVFYWALGTTTQIYTVNSPSLTEFERLKLEHSSNLECPCSNLHTQYARVMSIIPHYHPICSSDFIENIWLSYFGRVELDIESIDFITPDFRTSGQTFFDLIRSFCLISKETVDNALRVFHSTDFITIDAFSREQFNNQVETRLKQFQQQTMTSFLNLVHLIRLSIHNNHLITEMWTNVGPKSEFDNQTLKYSLSFRHRNFFTNSCSCGLTNNCTRPTGFYLQSDSMLSVPNATVPGLVLGCHQMDSVLLSTLECFYDWQCIRLIIDKYDFDITGLVRPLDPRITHIRPLQYNESSRFPPNTTMESIISQLFIEDWVPSINFTNYYTHCAPKQCTYRLRQRHNLVLACAIMLGCYGGLCAIVETFLPYVIRLCRRLKEKRQRNAVSKTADMPVNRMNRQTQFQKFLPTRMSLLIFSLTVVVCLLYFILLNHTVKTKSIPSPAADSFNNLSYRQSSTLSCPCSNVTVTHSKILSITPDYHMICSSNLVSSSYWTELFDKGDYTSLLLSSQYQLLTSLCNYTKSIIENAEHTFDNRELITTEAMTRTAFDSHMKTLVDSFKQDVSDEYDRTLSLIMGSFQVNQLLNMFTSNWQLDFTNETEDNIIMTRPRSFPISNCTCATTSDCIERIRSDVIVGCFPFDGFRFTLYDNKSLGQLNKKLFVKTWHHSSNYSAYFQSCQPRECRYMEFDRHNPSLMILTIVMLYGGLAYGVLLIINLVSHCYHGRKRDSQQAQIDAL